MADQLVSGAPDVPSSLTAQILSGEDARQDALSSKRAVRTTDDGLIGVGDERLGVGTAIRSGDVMLLVALVLITLVDGIDGAILPVLGPDIQSSLKMSDTVLGAIGGASGVLFVLGGIPLATLSDRVRRTRLGGVCTAVFGLVGLVTATVITPFWMFVARSGAGIAQSNSLPVHGSLISDAYPVKARAQVFSIYGLGGIIGVILGPLVVGAIAASVEGDDGWRLAFVVSGVAAIAVAGLLFTRREPKRGVHEQMAVFGEVHSTDTENQAPISISMAFARLNLVKTFRYMLLGLGALGFSLFSAPIFVNKILEDRFELSALERGVVGSLTALPALLSVPWSGRAYGRLLATAPPRSVLLCSLLMASFGVFLTAALYMPGLVSFAIVLALSTAAARAAFTYIGPLVAAVVPYRLRSQGFAMIGVYIFLMGAFLGAVLTGMMSDAWGERVALTIVVVPSAIAGAGLLAFGAVHIRDDMARIVEELEEERAESLRAVEYGADAPLLQVHNLDFSYESVQVLFGVDLEVRRGEVLALLGTNGAGKSTLLNCICGLGVPSRGVVRLEGRSITYAEPAHRVRSGIVAVQGGRAVWGPMSVRENLRLGAFMHRGDPHRSAEREREVLAVFPELAERLDQTASSLSGGQQQMLALAKAMLLDPTVLIIDELSLGLSPVATAQIVDRIRELNEQGLTIVIVEQSVNVALSIADRAVFMEKGRVRFSGPAHDLLDRGDLLRAVFLGADGG